MAKYILHGGGVRTSADEGKAFFGEMVRGLGKEPKILLCFFAQQSDIWQAKYAEWRVRIAACVPKVNVQFGLATVKDFAAQSQQYDALYVYGGDSRKLVNELKQIGNHNVILDRFKVMAGASAGAIMMSKYAWDCDERKIVEGLDFVPAKILVHYQSETYGKDDPRGPIDWQKAWDELAGFDSPNIPIIELPEGEFEAFE